LRRKKAKTKDVIAERTGNRGFVTSACKGRTQAIVGRRERGLEEHVRRVAQRKRQNWCRFAEHNAAGKFGTEGSA